MYDFHLHSEYSIDSKASMESMVLAAIDNNLKSICFTDHVDLDSTVERIDFVFRTSDYFKNIRQVKYKYMKDIEILAGVEIGIQPHLFERYNEFIDDNNFDFVLMSVHSVNKLDIHADGFTKEIEPLKALEAYYNDMYTCVKGFNNFDILGHLDYIDRYFDDYSTIPKYDEYHYMIESILKILIENGKGIEINTAGMRYGLGYFHPKIQILKLYRELGGEIITIGSDSHKPDTIGYGYRSAEKMLKELGFKYVHIFKERKKFPINIV
ncbi:histidinol-phosphatase HisJ family protein [Tissierella pigra]|uniref:Histidinol-phosphatase n=1 Tax=Tissierella pigra TaxID=2607614 RepID=A0A6N7XNR9_9FIRM|nr:histidinol-phosphatase HisJ family protein [Tissierella pigra]MBU5426387.1 histidinol-phosphatase HisJ family protein [Tissierella pigra]MSU03146.1 histidinol-phosphatase HisJ family protein [Tissierella pigra]